MKKCSSCGYFSINGGGFYKGQPHCKNKRSEKYNLLVAADKLCCDQHASRAMVKARRICTKCAVDAATAISHVTNNAILWAILDIELTEKHRSTILVATIRRLRKLKKEKTWKTKDQSDI